MNKYVFKDNGGVMRQSVFIITNEENKEVAHRTHQNIPGSKMIKFAGYFLDDAKLCELANQCIGDFFYVIKPTEELIFLDFDFNYTPDAWDRHYLHVWNNDTVLRLYCKELALSETYKYDDTALDAGRAELKNHTEMVYSGLVPDIIFLSYDEPTANENFEKLKKRFPRAKRVEHVKGIVEAHKAAANISKTDMFFVVDADADVVPEFDFSFNPPLYDRLSVYVWHSRNPVNGLEYGYGGIKLFPRRLVLDYAGRPVDFTTTVSKYFNLIPEVSNITRFNVDPFSAWRSGFREAVKLASRIITNQDDNETKERLDAWCNKGKDEEFGDFVLMGANEGAEFGRQYADQPDMLGLINDFDWLEKRFSG